MIVLQGAVFNEQPKEPRDLMSQWPSNYSISSSYVDGHATYSHFVDSDAAAKRFYQKSSGGHYGEDDPMHIDLQAIRGSYVQTLARSCLRPDT